MAKVRVSFRVTCVPLGTPSWLTLGPRVVSGYRWVPLVPIGIARYLAVPLGTPRYGTTIHAPVASKARPRFLRWGCDITYNKAKLEATSGLLERRVDVIEHHLFDEREKDNRFEAMEKFMSQQFPTFKPLNTGYQAESSSRTVTEEKTIEKQDELNDAPLPDRLPDPLPDQLKVEVHQEADVINSTCSTGIARRVRRWIDRKPKEVQSPFTTGQYKKRTLTKKAVTRPARTATTFIHVETVKSPEPRPAAAEIEYAGRPMIDENMRMFIDDYLKKYTDKVPLGTARYCSVPIRTARFLLADYLGTARYCSVPLDTVRFLNIFEHVPPQGSTLYKYDSKQYVSHVSKESVRAANLLLMPVSDNEHWTLLVADLKSLSWTFFDSLPNLSHKAVLPDVINHLHEETEDCFESDIRSWPLTIASGVPT
ncbi:hypothetical protein IEQ34_008891 [Dendrobium chrysotoxum]|uniref:Ubiquitin-like protease family profile domain-containing protein n=1 Tax=Dendrobium chrysotoxum TaxID=161865 RepID=A0AAV7GZ02_DENCH|nr:hypothetical protein IEQ34_008891 [Dendrobium chrysotoxum]